MSFVSLLYKLALPLYKIVDPHLTYYFFQYIPQQEMDINTRLAMNQGLKSPKCA